MSATATRPPDQRNPMIDEDDLVWLVQNGWWLGVPNHASEREVHRALLALEWMQKQKLDG